MEDSGDNSGNFAQQDLPITESVCTEWTNEKHSLYLKSMEALFVEQLYDSMDLLNLKYPKGTSDQNISTSSSQFKVLQGGCWRRINFHRPEKHVKNGSHEILTNPWVQHYKSARTLQISRQVTNDMNEKNLVDCNTVEVSDQNFVDEDTENEKKSSNCSSKGLKIRKKAGSSKN